MFRDKLKSSVGLMDSMGNGGGDDNISTIDGLRVLAFVFLWGLSCCVFMMGDSGDLRNEEL